MKRLEQVRSHNRERQPTRLRQLQADLIVALNFSPLTLLRGRNRYMKARQQALISTTYGYMLTQDHRRREHGPCNTCASGPPCTSLVHSWGHMAAERMRAQPFYSCHATMWATWLLHTCSNSRIEVHRPSRNNVHCFASEYIWGHV